MTISDPGPLGGSASEPLIFGHPFGMVGVVVIEVHMPACRSLKDKRSVLRPVIEGLRTRHPATVAEVGHQDLHQRAVIEVAVAGSSARVVGETLDAIERQVWSHGGLEVIAARRRWSKDE